MNRLFTGLAGLIAIFAFAGGSATAAPSPKLPRPLPAHGQQRVCTAALMGLAYCDAHVVTADGGAAPLATPSYQYGYTPQNLAAAYKWSDPTGSAWTWNKQTIAIVDAYDNPNAASDLAAYRSQFGLPACSSANGCFAKVNQRGGTAPPAANTGWGQEIDLDIEMVSAVCPNCKILLVESDSNSFTDLGAAVNEAIALGATAISNSYGGGEFFGETGYAGPYNHPGVPITASSGDGGYGVEVPAAYNTVVAVGGTSLTTAANARGWTETAWNGAGSGCSSQISKRTWQADTACSRRMVADVSAVSDPNTGVAVYDSYGSSGGANWYVFGGTSVAAPIIASVYGLAGNAAATDYPARLAYASPGSLFDVTSGSNGNCTKRHNTSTRYYCTAGPGYDGPTGLGTPNGLGGF
ncbi:MAG: peptidase S8 [Actinobacteria bacterium]|nr:MAG: peptidase S8 [Actinomycetota bacterium]TMM27440.1 MAG: peptidase S8 [Actinomycetota bacterium]